MMLDIENKIKIQTYTFVSSGKFRSKQLSRQVMHELTMQFPNVEWR